jgi:hypothetical protein
VFGVVDTEFIVARDFGILPPIGGIFFRLLRLASANPKYFRWAFKARSGVGLWGSYLESPMAIESQAKRGPRIDSAVSQQILDRLAVIGGINGEEKNDLIRRCLLLGLAQVEAEISSHYSFKNSVAVHAKLQRRGQDWDAALDILDSGPLTKEQAGAVILLLKGASG